MKRSFAAFVAVGLLVPCLTIGPAHADTQICDQYGKAVTPGGYVVQNNRYGSGAEQCINVTDAGFSITAQQGSAPTNGAPVSFPSIYVGCHYNTCSPGTNLPMQVSRISSATSTVSNTYAGGTYNAAYDIWLDPAPKTDGVNQMELMIWLDRQGPIQPIGSPVGALAVAGRSWDVWSGGNGSNNVITYVSPAPISSLSFSVLDFINDARGRAAITGEWFLTSIQAGFEPWNGGVGLAANSFSAVVTG